MRPRAYATGAALVGRAQALAADPAIDTKSA